MATLRERAAEVLRANDRGAYTVPSPHLYPHQWAWDSAFAAIGWAHLDLGRAVRELETLMAGAWPDGRVPHIYFHDLDGEYFPGPPFWGTERSSSITQPPVWATAARRLADLGADVSHLVPAIDASHQFFADHRDPLDIGAVAVVHPWESGLDNSPAWDHPLGAVDPANAPPFKRVDTECVEDPSERPDDDTYRRYAALVKGIADDSLGPGAFAVYDPMMTALLLQAERDLAALGVASADFRAGRLAQGLERLWHPELGRYGFHCAVAGRDLTPDVVSAYVPLVCGVHSDALRDGLRARFDTAHPLPSCAPSDPAFDARCYWRGPTWVNVNWLLADHVDLDLAERTLRLIEREGFREYYDPHTGAGLGARQFTWTAALALDWLAQG